MVACIGFNPSTATPSKLDTTANRVKKIAEYNDFGGWVMYNVYPQRATNSKDLDKEINDDLRLTNIEIISKSIQDLGINTIWVAYGDLIKSRNYLPFCMTSLYSSLKHLNLNWKITELNVLGHPKHPLYTKTESKFIDFDIKKYIEEILAPKTK